MLRLPRKRPWQAAKPPRHRQGALQPDRAPSRCAGLSLHLRKDPEKPATASSLAISAVNRSTFFSAACMAFFNGARLARLSAAALRAAARTLFALPSDSIAVRRVRSFAPRCEKHLAVAVEIAVVGFHRALRDDPKPVGRRLDEVAVVADQDDGAFILGERVDQRLAAVDIEVVGRLVENEQVRRVEGVMASSRRAFSPPERCSHLVSALSWLKPKAPRRARALGFGGVRHQAHECFIWRRQRIELVELMLGEVADIDAAGAEDVAG